jgi:HSP20 family protein
MALMRRSMDRPVMPLRTAIERLMSDWPLLAGEGGLTELAPPIDVRETDDTYIVEIDLPGVSPEDTEVLVEGRTVTIRGAFTQEDERREGNYLLRERRSGQFMRAIALPGMVDLDGITTRFENGQLMITLPKAAQNRARRIEITPGDQQRKAATGGQQSAGQQAASGTQGATSGQPGQQAAAGTASGQRSGSEAMSTSGSGAGEGMGSAGQPGMSGERSPGDPGR